MVERGAYSIRKNIVPISRRDAVQAVTLLNSGLAVIYEHLWTSKSNPAYLSQVVDMFEQFGIDTLKVQVGLRRLQGELLFETNKYPPTIPNFIMKCIGEDQRVPSLNEAYNEAIQLVYLEGDKKLLASSPLVYHSTYGITQPNGQPFLRDISYSLKNDSALDSKKLFEGNYSAAHNYLFTDDSTDANIHALIN